MAGAYARLKELQNAERQRARYQEALEQIRDAPHAPDAWIVAATALMPEPPEAPDESHP